MRHAIYLMTLKVLGAQPSSSEGPLPARSRAFPQANSRVRCLRSRDVLSWLSVTSPVLGACILFQQRTLSTRTGKRGWSA